MKKLIIGDNIQKSFGEGSERHNVLGGVSVEIDEENSLRLWGHQVLENRR